MKVLLCPLATHGFVYPMIGVALELRRRGHDVAFVTGLSFRDILAQFDLERIPRGDKDGPSFEVERWMQPLLVAMQYKHIEYAVARFSPDVLFGHTLSLGPLIAAERMGLPVGILGMAAYLLPLGEARAPAPGTAFDEGWEAWRGADILRYLEHARALFKLGPITKSPPSKALVGDVHLLQSIPALAPNADALPPDVHLVGSCVFDPPVAPEVEREIERFCDGSSPVVYVQHGRSFDQPGFWPLVVEALADKPIRVLASVGRMERDPGPAPPNFFVRPHIPQSVALRSSRAVICGGNTTTVLGALTRGLPLLLFPRGGEQPDVAKAVERAGAGRRLDASRVTPAELETSVFSLLDDETARERARAMQREFEQLDGPALVAEHIERLARA